MAFSAFLLRLLDMVAPPRRTEQLVRGLSLDELRAILLRGEKSGSLPYHDARVTALVWELKYYANVHAATLAGNILSDVLIGIASETLGKPLLIPIPMHRARKRMRGHNQTELLCEKALVHVHNFFEYTPRALSRIRHTPAQQSLQKNERGTNLEGSMVVQTRNVVHGRVCVVIDDVSTTGATFAEAARALKEAGAAQVECVALAYS